MKAAIHWLIILTLCMPVMVFGQAKNSAPQPTLRTIVIDPGHGGTSPGCTWGNILEKDLNLAVAKILGELISTNYPDVKVIYTRTDDSSVELMERGEIANRANADLFLSIHTDAVTNTSANGSSSYVMGNDKAARNLEVAMRENSVIVLESDYDTKYEGYDPNSAESFIIFSLMQYAHSEQSMIFAELIQKHNGRNTPIINRGARQAPYLVLWKTTMPSVLTEMGFLTNKSDRAFLTTEEGQRKIAKALFDAFAEYKNKLEHKAGAAVPNVAAPNAAAPEPSAKPAADSVRSAEPQQPAATPKPDSLAGADSKQPEAAATSNICFYVQLCTLANLSDPADPKFKSFKGQIVQKKTAGKYRCLVEAPTYADAVELRDRARADFKGAFVVAFEGDEPISIEKALKQVNQKKP